MASTITIKTDAVGSGRYLQLDCKQKVDIAKNASTIEWTLTSAGGTSYYFSTGPTTVTINGTQVYYIARKDWTTEVFPAAKGSVSGELIIKHNDNGKKSISVSLSTAIYTATVSTYSKNWELDSIPRKATLTNVPNFTDEDNPTITYSNLAGTAVTSLKACIASASAPITAYSEELSKTGSSYTFKFTDADRDALRKAITGPSGMVYVSLRSVIGGISYEHNVPCTLTINESDKTKPNVTLGVTLNNSNLPSGFDGVYVQNKSRVDVTLTAQGKYNANIESKYVSIGLETYKTLPFTSNVLTSSGNVKIVGYAKDSRGFTGNDTETVNVVEYSKPLVIPLGNDNSIQCYRSDGNGKRVGKSTSLWVKAMKSYHTVTVDGVQKNFCALEYRSKLSTEEWNDSTHPWVVLIPKTDTTTNEYNALIANTVFDQKKSYTIQIRAIDDIGEYDFKTFDIPTADVALHLGRGGKNVSVGSYCEYEEEYTFHSEWKGIFDNGIKGTSINQAVEGDLHEFAKSCSEGVTPIYIKDKTVANTPTNEVYASATGFVQKGNDGRITVYLVGHHNLSIAVKFYTPTSGWQGWHYMKFTT